MKNSIIKGVLFAVISAVISVAVLIAVFALIAFNTSDPTKYVKSFGVAILIISCLVCGFTAARKTDTTIFTAPLCAVGAYLLLYLLTTLITGTETRGFLYFVLLYAGSLAAGLVGALLGRRKKPTKPKSFKKYSKLKKSI